MTAAKPPAGRGDAARAVIFEFLQIGNSTKVTAVDEATGLEVSIVGPSTAMRLDLERLAKSKLMRALERYAGGKGSAR
jgi:hypothetical protein